MQSHRAPKIPKGCLIIAWVIGALIIGWAIFALWFGQKVGAL